MRKTAGLLVIAVIVLFLSFPNIGNAADLKQGAVVCTSEHLLDLYNVGDQKTKDHLLKTGCSISSGKRGVAVSEIKGDHAWVSVHGDLPSLWTNKENVIHSTMK